MTAIHASDNTRDPVLRVEGLGKVYGPITALEDVTLEIQRGTIHGLLGENGAGKSTLVGLISGQKQPSHGRILLNGKPLENVDVKSMEEAGVFLVTQEPMIIDHLTAAENLMLGILPQNRGLVKWDKVYSDAGEQLRDTGINPRALAGKLDAVSRRKLNILRAMFSGGEVIILDEPTAALTVEDRKALFDFMRKLKNDGVTLIFISHYNDEILDICDSVSVLRNGRLAGGTDDLSQLTSEKLSELVLGRGLKLFQRKQKTFNNVDPVARIKNIVSDYVSVSELNIYSGEIIGFTGLPGEGAKELARLLFGLSQVQSGEISFLSDGQTIPIPSSPSEAFNAGIAYLSDDRRKEGLVGQMSIRENISLSSLDKLSQLGVLQDREENHLSERYFKSMGIKAEGFEVPVDTLSGGNQQKVCIARILATQPRILLLDEPTRGIDVGVKQDVLRIIDELTQNGVSIIMISTDTDELVRSADRVLIFSNGKISKEIIGESITNESLRMIGSENMALVN